MHTGTADKQKRSATMSSAAIGFIYFGCLAASIVLAKYKGRPVVTCVAWTIVFGIFAVLVLCFKPNLRKTRCPYCRSTIDVRAAACRHCGRLVSTTA